MNTTGTDTLTTAGILILVMVLLLASKGRGGKVVAAILGVLLLGMVYINWPRIQPLLMTSNGRPTAATSGIPSGG